MGGPEDVASWAPVLYTVEGPGSLAGCFRHLIAVVARMELNRWLSSRTAR
jgi:hypothetical protein